jgi:nicotinate (nicotinamide) nucleotide adenylyltransferase
MQLGIYPGSFDPSHKGHLFVCEEAIKSGIDKILIVPSYNHALKNNIANYDFRFKLCEETFKDLKDVEISYIEKIYEIKYTIDTLNVVRDIYKYDEYRLLIGRDILEETYKWKDWDQIIKIAEPFVVNRELDSISSTTIRGYLKEGKVKECESMLTSSVLKILETENPYL